MANGVNGKKFLGADEYEKYAAELREEGTIDGRVLTKEERKEGFNVEKKTKIDFEKFVKKVLSRDEGEVDKGSEQKQITPIVDKSRLLPGTKFENLKKPEDEDTPSRESTDNEKDGEEKSNAEIDKNKDKIEEVLGFIRNFLDPSLTRIEQSLDGILGNLSDEIEADKDKAEDLKGDIADAKMDTREDELESKKKGFGGQMVEKAVKPVENFLGTVLKFFINVLLGAVVMRILKIIENPKRLFDPLFRVINQIIWVINQLSEALWFISSNVIKGIGFALTLGPNLLIKGINKALELLPFVDFQIPELKLPELPSAHQIPYIETVDKPVPPASVQGAAGGGEIVNVNQISYHQGGPIESDSGVKVEGMGPDTQLVAAQPGEVVMSKGAVDAIGKDTLLAMNAEAGGDNQPKLGSLMGNRVSAMRGGGLVPGSVVYSRAEKGPGGVFQGSSTPVQLYSKGGLVNRSYVYPKFFQGGGVVKGPEGVDQVPAQLTAGEFVMSKGAVEKYGTATFETMNSLGGGTNKPKQDKGITPSPLKFEGGGEVISPPTPPSNGGTNVTVLPASQGGGASGGGGGSTNEQSPIPTIPSQDSSNSELYVIKSIYNIGT